MQAVAEETMELLILYETLEMSCLRQNGCVVVHMDFQKPEEDPGFCDVDNEYVDNEIFKHVANQEDMVPRMEEVQYCENVTYVKIKTFNIC